MQGTERSRRGCVHICCECVGGCEASTLVVEIKCVHAYTVLFFVHAFSTVVSILFQSRTKAKKKRNEYLLSFFFLNTYILIGHLPVRSLSVWHHLPHDNPIAPHIACWGELPVCDCLRSRPANGNLPTLQWNGLAWMQIPLWKIKQCFTSTLTSKPFNVKVADF